MNRDAEVAQILELQGRLMRTSMRHHSRTMVDEHLTPVQFHLLLHLHSHPGVPTSDAAGALDIRANIATGVIQRLVERGWVRREQSPEDGRVRLLSLTDAGVTLVNEAVAEAERGFISHLNALSDEQVVQLRGILGTILAAVGDEPAQ
ncbi:MarR family winged helix-turn-helix transcriptional regulator [Demequina globuliformis]|uniref:MarR family winged helix-turn-helix transcriptional regulator n=1 Tax=Demequina globuliformis TaxID=676202 RepID=UPI0007827EB0|nr:MarR family transcriptional regulator [Demequina globuliformis]